MSPQAKVSWEDVTKWFVRITGGMAFCLSGFFLNSFNEVKADVKILLQNDAVIRSELKHIERRVDRNESRIDKLKAGK